MSVKLELGFNHHQEKVAISSITVEDLDIIEREIEVLEEVVSSKSKQLEDHVSMLDSVHASIALMEAEEMAKVAAEEKKHIERAKSLESLATTLSDNVSQIDAKVAIKEEELSQSVSIQLEMKLDLDNDFATWYSYSADYYNAQTVYTKANILQTPVCEVIQKQEASIILSKELALDESAKSLLDIIQESTSSSIIKVENWHNELAALKEKALSYGLYSANTPGEIVKRLIHVEEALYNLEKLGVKEEIEALVSSMKFAESDEVSVDKEKIRSFREGIKSLQDDAKEYKVYQDWLHAWQVLDSIKPQEMQEAENQRHARMLSKKQEHLALEEEQKASSVMSHAFSEAQSKSERS